jgi:hypothetical protein
MTWTNGMIEPISDQRRLTTSRLLLASPSSRPCCCSRLDVDSQQTSQHTHSFRQFSLVDRVTNPTPFTFHFRPSNLHAFFIDFDFPGGNNIDRLEPERHRSNIVKYQSLCQIEISSNGFSIDLHPQRARLGSGSQGYDRSYRPLVSPLNRFSIHKEQSSRRTLTRCLLTSFRLNPPLATANNDFSYLL